MIPEVKKIHDLVYVFSYKDELKNVYKLLADGYNDPENSPHFGGWVPWSTFGEYVNNPQEEKNFDGERAQKESHAVHTVNEIFKETTDYYLNDFNLTADPEWRRMGPSFCRYFDNVGGHWNHIGNEENPRTKGVELAMVYHTDYVYQDRFEDSWKFILTCTMYLNDDYEGGDLKFKLNDETFEYKPKAGDVVVFPSGHPDLLSENGVFFHAVGAISKNPKYFIRCFYQKYTEGIKK